MNISPVEVLVFRKEHSPAEMAWAEKISAMYGARPLKNDAENFYTFVLDVFHAGEISGKRGERAKRREAM